MMAAPAVSMPVQDLIEWAKAGGSDSPGVEVCQKYDRGCMQKIPTELINFQDLGKGKIRGVTRYAACYGVMLVSFEMQRGNLRSLRIVSAVGAGRAMNYSNWTSLDREQLGMSQTQLQAIAIALNTTEEEI